MFPVILYVKCEIFYFGKNYFFILVEHDFRFFIFDSTCGFAKCPHFSICRFSGFSADFAFSVSEGFANNPDFDRCAGFRFVKDLLMQVLEAG